MNRRQLPDCACENVCMFPRWCYRRAKQKMEIAKTRSRWQWPEYEAMTAAREMTAKANKGLLKRIATAMAGW